MEKISVYKNVVFLIIEMPPGTNLKTNYRQGKMLAILSMTKGWVNILTIKYKIR